jgi:hypothetical protein
VRKEEPIMRIRAFFIVLLVSSLFVSCHTAKFGLYVLPRQQRPFTIIKHVKVESKGGWLFQLVPVKETKVHQLLMKEVEDVQGDNVINVVITDKENAIDVLVSGAISSAVYALLYGISKDSALSNDISSLATIYQTRTYIIEADIIKYASAENEGK